MRVVFAAARSAPGVTTAVLACASVWPGRVLVVEASEDGGALAARYRLTFQPGATTLAAAVRRDPGPDVLWAHTQALPGTDGRLQALVGPPAAEPAQAWLRTAARPLAGLLGTVDETTTVLIDAGRLGPSPAAAPLIAAADRFVLVARPRVEEIQTLKTRLAVLRGLGPQPHLLLVGDRPYGPGEVAEALGCPVLGVLADDRTAAEALGGDPAGAAGLRRSDLLRTAACVIDELAAAPVAEEERVASRAGGGSWTATAVPRRG